MKKIYFVLLLLVFTILGQSQDRRDNLTDRIEVKKIGYLTDKLDLTPEEAQVFWPIYNMYSDKMKAYSRNHESAKVSDKETMSADDKISDLIKNEKERLSIKEEYISKFKQVIGSEKTLELLKSERGFKKEVLQSIRKRKEKGLKGYRKEKEKNK